MNKFVIIKIVSVVVAAISQIFLKISANKTFENKIKEYLNPLVITAYGFFFFSMLLSMYSLKGTTVSLLMIIESLSYILIPIFGFLFFKERLNKYQYIGIVIILLGILVYNI